MRTKRNKEDHRRSCGNRLIEKSNDTIAPALGADSGAGGAPSLRKYARTKRETRRIIDDPAEVD